MLDMENSSRTHPIGNKPAFLGNADDETSAVLAPLFGVVVFLALLPYLHILLLHRHLPTGFKMWLSSVVQFWQHDLRASLREGLRVELKPLPSVRHLIATADAAEVSHRRKETAPLGPNSAVREADVRLIYAGDKDWELQDKVVLILKLSLGLSAIRVIERV